MRSVFDGICWVAHRMWRVPIWRESAFLACPTGWLCNHWPAFERWYWKEID